MQQHNLIQGTPEWHAHRARCWNASDAPAMMGCSPYESRSAFIKRIATGITPEVDAATQRRFDDGHRFEALARPRAEAIVGEDLSPLSGSIDAGLSRRLAASFDGITFMGDMVFEHKSLNNDIRDCIVDEASGNLLPALYRVQMEQQLMVSGAERCLFMATKWEGDTLVEERWTWYYANPNLRDRLLAGWRQAEIDVAAYVAPERAAAEVVVARPVTALPAVSVQVTGEISVRDNFPAFETAVRDFIEHRLIREPKSDQDFADLDQQIKAMKGAEAALEAAEGQMLAQVAAIDTAKRAKDMLAKLVRDNRLIAEKLLASEKERRRGEIVAVGVTALREHIAALNQRLGQNYMPAVPADFGAAIKGKKNLASMEDAVSTELARAKIAANEIADRIDANLKTLDGVSAEHTALFPDRSTIVHKAPEDLQVLVRARVAEHDAAVKRRAEEAAERERERIRSEEAAKLKREQEEAPTPAPQPAPMVGSPAAADPTRACAVDRVVSAPAPKDTRPPITTGALCARFGDGMTVTAAFLQSLGFEPAPRPADAKSGTYWREADFPRICRAIAARMEEAAEGVPA